MSTVILFCFSLWSLFGVFSCEFVSVTEGDSVTLSVSVTEVKDEISWKFGAQDVVIAEINAEDKNISLYEDRADGRFRDRLKLDQTGSLTITNIRITDSGLYKVTKTSKNIQLNIFNVTVYDYLPVPVITGDSPLQSQFMKLPTSEESYCSVLCSVMNVSHDVSLSWYKGISLLSSISVSDLNIRLSLPLEVEYQDNSTYRCVINNPISNQTQHLNITDVCHKCSGYCCCGFTEAVIRLVISSLVGVATVAVLVYDIRSRGDEQKKADTQLNN